MAGFTGSPYAMLLTSILLGTVGQLLLKNGMLHQKSTAVGSAALMSAVRAIANPWVFMGFVAYGLSSIIWLMILRKLPLSIAYPMISLSYVFVVVLSVVVFPHEKQPNWVFAIPGLMLIMMGVSLIGLGSSR